MVVAGRPVVTEGHVFVISEEELGIYRIDSLITSRQLIGLTVMSSQTHPTWWYRTFALIPLAGNFAKDAALADLGLGGAGV